MKRVYHCSRITLAFRAIASLRGVAHLPSEFTTRLETVLEKVTSKTNSSEETSSDAYGGH
ncbi:hypothetical protein [Nostoc sp. UIC 10630]|uniref:hypothetical protein n=1 Tax=Nostoc sp. UIC 10630 TaxID=2100146 RepID=UPI0013D49715|nr:hypothetical protein [Nostoc sp. UIC 10630]NEU77580.1 hypothetical protein [Nostoc sp. UIC 10630]